MRLWRKRIYVKRWFLSYNYRDGNTTGFGSGEIFIKYEHKRDSETIKNYKHVQDLADKIKENYGFDNIVVLWYCVMSAGYAYAEPKMETKK